MILAKRKLCSGLTAEQAFFEMRRTVVQPNSKCHAAVSVAKIGVIFAGCKVQRHLIHQIYHNCKLFNALKELFTYNSRKHSICQSNYDIIEMNIHLSYNKKGLSSCFLCACLRIAGARLDFYPWARGAHMGVYCFAIKRTFESFFTAHGAIKGCAWNFCRTTKRRMALFIPKAPLEMKKCSNKQELVKTV